MLKYAGDCSEEERALWIAFKQNGDQTAKEALILKYRLWCYGFLHRLRSFERKADREDAISSILIVLIESVDKFEPERGIKFKTYVRHRVNGAILDYFRQIDPLGRAARDQIKEIHAVEVIFFNRNGYFPSIKEIADATSLSEDQVTRALVADRRETEMVFLDACFPGSDKSIGEVYGPSEEMTIESDLEREKSFGTIISLAESHFSERDFQIFKEYYLEGRLQGEIASKIGVAESRICQILARLRKKLYIKYNNILYREELHPNAQVS